MTKKEKMTTIALPMRVKDNVAEYGLKGESYGEIIERLLKSARERMLRDVLMDETDCVTIEEARKELNKKWPKL
jgi:predicted CopG family antitoxin